MKHSSANNSFIRCRPSMGLCACLCVKLSKHLNTFSTIFCFHWLSFAVFRSDLVFFAVFRCFVWDSPVFWQEIDTRKTSFVHLSAGFSRLSLFFTDFHHLFGNWMDWSNIVPFMPAAYILWFFCTVVFLFQGFFYIFTLRTLIVVVVSWNSSVDWSQGGHKSSQSAENKEPRCCWEDSSRNSESQIVPASTHH